MSFEEVRLQLNTSRELTQTSVDQLAIARDRIEEAVTMLDVVSAEGQSLDEPIAHFRAFLEGVRVMLKGMVTVSSHVDSYVNIQDMETLPELTVAESEVAVTEYTKEPSAAEPQPDGTAEETESRTAPEDLERYRAARQRLRQQIIAAAKSGDPDAHKKIEGYVDSGATHHVFIINQGTDVIKVPVYAEATNYGWDIMRGLQLTAVTALQLSKGHKNFEQMVTAVDMGGPHGGAIITNYVEGPTLSAMSPEERDRIPQAHFDDLIKAIEFAQSRGLWLDNMGADKNIIHNPKNGFIIIDASLAGTSRKPSLATAVRDFAQDFLFIDNARKNDPKTPLPQSMKTFYRSYEQAFGKEDGNKLKEIWSKRHHMPAQL